MHHSRLWRSTGQQQTHDRNLDTSNKSTSLVRDSEMILGRMVARLTGRLKLSSFGLRYFSAT